MRTLITRIEWVLDKLLPHANTSPARLHQAMRYSVLNGGKRLRPLLVYGSGRLFQKEPLGESITLLDRVAAAIECIHAYSLIHDDLPAMDNDVLRRGKPTCHKAFDEATAILAGDALQAFAFQILAAPDPPHTVHLVAHLARLIGSTGIAGGQMLDLDKKDFSNPSFLEHIYQLKTGALFEASVILGALAEGFRDAETLQCLKSFARNLSVAFQIQDDLVDLEKQTYPALFGIPYSQTRVSELRTSALNALASFDESADLLRNIAQYV